MNNLSFNFKDDDQNEKPVLIINYNFTHIKKLNSPLS